MNKKFTKTLLAGAVFGLLASASASASIGVYSLYQGDNDSNQNSDVGLSSAKYKIVFSHETGKGVILYGDNSDISANNGKLIFAFDAQGNVTQLADGTSVKIHNADLAEFARSVMDGKAIKVQDVHNMSEGEVRSLIQDVEARVAARGEIESKIAANASDTANLNSLIKRNDSNGSLSVGGHDAIAFGTSATAVGEGAYARENNTTAVGAYSSANAANSSALGVASQAYGKNSVAVGAAAHVAKDAANSVAVGAGANATHKNSVALGTQSVTTRDDEVNIGYKNSQGTGTRVLGGLSDGQLATDAATVGQLNQTKQTAQKNSQSIAANSRQLQEHNARLNDHQRQIRENHEEMKRAAAQSAALAGLFQPYSVGKFNATAALGGYSDKQAVAVGVGYRFNEQTAAKAGIAASDGDVS
ncbi:TPA: hypothetical protein JW546_004940, partial [Escherichia coli]|nr:hypothetical protein [Escherichia coli]